jgi:nitroreductase
MNEIETYPQLDVIFKRRSIRQFKPNSVPTELIDMLLKAGMAAPSAMNKQPWEFVVIDSEEILSHLRTVMPYAPHIAPLAIVTCANMEKRQTKINADGFWVQDCSAATENMLLAAVGLGLSAVWIGVYPAPEFVKHIVNALDIPQHIIPVSMILVGYGEKVKEPRTQYNPEVVFLNKYGKSEK